MILVWKIELLQGINLIPNYVIWVKHIFAFHEVLIIVHNCYPLPVLAATFFFIFAGNMHNVIENDFI